METPSARPNFDHTLFKRITHCFCKNVCSLQWNLLTYIEDYQTYIGSHWAQIEYQWNKCRGYGVWTMHSIALFFLSRMLSRYTVCPAVYQHISPFLWDHQAVARYYALMGVNVLDHNNLDLTPTGHLPWFLTSYSRVPISERPIVRCPVRTT